MIPIKKIEAVRFESLEELVRFINNGGKALYFSDVYDEFYSIVRGDDENSVSISYFTRTEIVTEDDMDCIFGYITLSNN